MPKRQKGEKYTVREFKFKKRAEFLVNFAKEVQKLSGNFLGMIHGKEHDRSFEPQLSAFKESYFQIVHFYEKFNNVYLKDSEVNRCMHSIIGSARVLNDMSDSVVFKNDIQAVKKDFSKELKEIVASFDSLSRRLNDFGVVMWV